VRVANRTAVYDHMRAADIGVQVHFVPIYRHQLYADLAVDPDAYPATEAAYAELLSLPLFPDLTEAEQDTVVDRLSQVVA